MKDPVIESYLRDFSAEYKKTHLPESDQFEHFVNYCVMAKHYTETFDPDDVSIGGGGDLGIDGIGIFVNDHLVQAQTDIEYHKKNLRRLDVEFVFVQSKTSSSFDGGDIGTFLAGVRCFFDEMLPSTANADILQAHELKKFIYGLTIDMDRPPLCHMYYATTGIWNNEPALATRIEQGRTDLEATKYFSEVRFTAVDADRLKRIYREIKNKFVRELTFDKHTILPEMVGVTEAYIGVVPGIEYLKILCDEEGILNRRLFYDNVRDFQGHNSVNSEIRLTITEESKQDRFCLLNNGVTIVAKDVSKVGAKFRLRDYQVVNGCQTSHVLYLAREHLSPKVFLPLKLIITSDTEVTNQIIQGANRQTEIKPEAFESLAPFQKELEETYLAVGKMLAVPVYYERRSKQYDDPGTDRDRVITLPAQIKAFIGMFLNEPHSTHRYYGELLESYRTRIFSEAHRFMPYVTSGCALASLERLLAKENLPRPFKHVRHQLLMGFRLRFGSGKMPALNSKGMDDYCAKLLSIINDEANYLSAILEVASILERLKDEGAPWREPPERTRSFTNSIIDNLSKGAVAQPAEPDREQGTLLEFSAVKRFGFIKSKFGARVFFHQNDVIDGDIAQLRPDAPVTYVSVVGPKGLRALHVRRSRSQ